MHNTTQPLMSTHSWIHSLVERALLCALLITCTNACSLQLPDAAPIEEITVCDRNADCTTGELCEAGFCVVAGEENVLEYIAFQLTPSNDSELTRNQYIDVEWSQGVPMPDLVLTKPIQVRGSTRTPDGTRVRAQILLKRTSPTIQGVNTLRFEADAFSSSLEYDFTVSVPTGTYDLLAFPEDERIPPQTIRGLNIQADTQISVPFSNLEAYHQVSGRIVFTDALSKEIVVIKDATIQAINEQNDVISTLGTSREDGSFTISVLPSVESLRLVIDSTEYHKPFPRVLTRAWPVDNEDVNLGDVYLGELHPLGRSVVGQLVSEKNGAPIAGAGLTFQGDLGAGVSTQTVWTNENGEYSLRLLPGSYVILVDPPTGDIHTVALLTPDPLPPSGESVPESLTKLSVGTKLVLEGLLFTPVTSKPLPGAKVIFEPQLYAALEGTEARDQQRLQASLPSQTVISDNTGTFSAFLNAGEYRVTVDPPVSSGLGQYVYNNVIIDDTSASLELISASRSNVAYGRVVDSTGAPVAGVQIDIFRAPEEGKSAEDDARRIGQGTTNSDGEYRIPLPYIRNLLPSASVAQP